MPVPPGTKYRFTTKNGKKIRLAILNGKVIEADRFKKNKEGKLKKVAHKKKSLGD